MRTGRILLSAALLGAIVLASSGCSGGKVSKSNYDKVQTGMTQAEVEKILGEGTEQAGVGGALGGIVASGKVITWTDADKTITITFVNGKVATKVQKGL